VPRTGQNLELVADFKPRPEWPWLRQMFYELSLFLVTDLDNQWESYQWTVKPLDWQLESGDRVSFAIVPEGERLTEPFNIADTVVIPTGSFRWIRYDVEAVAAEKRKISGEAKLSFGDFFLGKLTTVGVTLAIRPVPLLTVEVSGERNTATMPQGDFTQELYAGRVEFKLSSDLQVSSFLQYDNESRNFGTNTRLRWTFDPLGDLFVVFNHNLLRNDADRFGFDSNQLLVKLQYAVRW
jgi:hypothetical protein